MSIPLNSTRQKLILAALELFKTQGVGTPTRKIAELAEVNEVTLFRNFGSKYGLLLAVFEDLELFEKVGKSLAASVTSFQSPEETLRAYASNCLHLMRHASALICSVVGEAEQYPAENHRALGFGLTQINHQGIRYLASLKVGDCLNPALSLEAAVSLLHCLLLGYVMIEFTTDDNQLWRSQDDFLDSLVNLFLSSTEPQVAAASQAAATELPASAVHEILRRTRRLSSRDYALAYVLFAAGLSASEVADLQRSHQTADAHQHLLRVGALQRPVTINQWILGKRYGSYTANPLTKYLKNRKDSKSAMFLNASGEPITAAEVEERWQTWINEIQVAESGPEDIAQQTWTIAQAQHTWYIDMLLRGVSLENLSILSGLELEQLRPYAERAKEITALDQATRLDQKSSKSLS